MTRSLVTGGSGFIGSHVVDALSRLGHEVVVLDRVFPRHRPSVEFRAADITHLDPVCAALKGIDYVHHLAAEANVNNAFTQPVDCVTTNVLGTSNVLEAARRAGVKRVFFASSVWVYNGARATEVDEDTPIQMPGPGHVYTSSKLAGELLCHDYSVLYKLPVTIFRYGIAYGPRMREELLIPAFLKRALSHQSLQVSGDGSQARNFVYVEDLARAHALAHSDLCANQTFNLEGMRPIRVLEVAEAIKKLTGSTVPIERTPARPGDFQGKVVSLEKSARRLDWRPTTPFEEGMRRTFDWYVETHPTNGHNAKGVAVAL